MICGGKNLQTNFHLKNTSKGILGGPVVNTWHFHFRQRGELKLTGFGGASMWRQDNPQVGRRAITYPPPPSPQTHTLSPLLYVIFPPGPGEEGRQRWERAGLEVGLAYILENTVDCFGKILWPEITCHVCSSV